MRTPLIDGKRAGQFKARCNLARPLAINAMPHYLRREAEEKGWKKAHREVGGRLVECYLEPLCAGFETADPAAFEDHMKTVHGKRTVNGGAETWAQGIRKMWRGPRLTPEGKPFKDRDGRTTTCASCGLVADLAGSPEADRLWWDEHERGCAIAQAAS